MCVKLNDMVAKIVKENSTIVFTIKGFIAVITFIFTVFFGFYTLVIVPRFDIIDSTILEQNKINTEIIHTIADLNTNIAVLSESINNLKNNIKSNDKTN